MIIKSLLEEPTIDGTMQSIWVLADDAATNLTFTAHDARDIKAHFDNSDQPLTFGGQENPTLSVVS